MVYMYVCVSSVCDAFQLYIGEADYDIVWLWSDSLRSNVNFITYQ